MQQPLYVFFLDWKYHLLNLENFGKRSLFEVRDVVAQFNLKLGEGINKDLYYQQRVKQEDTSEETEEVVE